MYFFYYIPIGLDISTRKRPFVTYFLSITCVIAFLLYNYKPVGAWWDLTLLTFQPVAPTLATAITHAFLHGGWFHLIANLVYILVFGPPLEERLGSGKFYVVFALSAAAGAYTHTILTALFSPQYMQYGVIGASGATSGILGAYLVRLYFSRVRVAYWIFMPLQGVNRAGRTYVPIVFAVIFWFVLQGVRTLMQFGMGGMRVAYSVHLGGFAAGLVLALCFKAAGAARAERHLVAARRRFDEADWFGAQAEYSEYLALVQDDVQAHAGLARAFLAGGDTARSRSCYADAVRLSMKKGERDTAEALFDEAMRHMPNFALAEGIHLDLACGMERTLKYRSAMHAYEHFVWAYPFSKEAPFVLLRMGGIFEKRFGNPGMAFSCYSRLASEYASD
ncbi:MAG: rhomboid family intramembrane serine protease, partial [Candidatus Krumholzibacteria bacterium]|nr:rhomboid family intramembrane serine protease [Candidatus Krumholzibacteria bacterium]